MRLIDYLILLIVSKFHLQNKIVQKVQQLVEQWKGEKMSLPGEMVWSKGGLKYLFLGSFLGNEMIAQKNWENITENVDLD